MLHQTKIPTQSPAAGSERDGLCDQPLVSCCFLCIQLPQFTVSFFPCVIPIILQVVENCEKKNRVKRGASPETQKREWLKKLRKRYKDDRRYLDSYNQTITFLYNNLRNRNCWNCFADDLCPGDWEYGKHGPKWKPGFDGGRKRRSLMDIHLAEYQKGTHSHFRSCMVKSTFVQLLVTPTRSSFLELHSFSIAIGSALLMHGAFGIHTLPSSIARILQ